MTPNSGAMRIYECWVPIAPEIERQRIAAEDSFTARRLMAERVRFVTWSTLWPYGETGVSSNDP